ncbi:glycosyltransferase family 9 protein [Bacteroidota bacterium]
MPAKKDRHILLLRFSALGDVAIAAPLLKAYAKENPGVTFTMVSQPMLKPLFEGVPNINYFGTDFKKRHKGLKGIYTLFRDLLKLKPTHVADINSVLRTFILRIFFFFTPVKLSFVRKGRRERKMLTAKEGKRLFRMESTFRRYEKVLVSLGIKDLNLSSVISDRRAAGTQEENSQVKIGIAPFAAHRGKTWPAHKMEQVVEMLVRRGGYEILLFGGGKRESELLRGWECKYSGVRSLAGKVGFKDELEAMGEARLMVCMDSANMHFASAMGVPVLSIWGATHPYLGFYGWGQSEKMAVQSNLECRPCSSSGKKECFRGDYACMEEITPEMVFERILNFFDEKL